MAATDVSGVVFRPNPCFSGAGIDAQASYYSSSKPPSFLNVSGGLQLSCRRYSRMVMKSGNFTGFSSSLFRDDGHVQYYSGSTSRIRCGGGKKLKVEEKEAVKDTAEKKMKKRLKLLKGLTRDLSVFSEIGLGLDPDLALGDQDKGKMISEAAELLLGQLELLRAEEKEMKRKRKEEKTKLKPMRMQTRLECEESSNSSSESSNSECGEVVDMSCLKSGNEEKEMNVKTREEKTKLTAMRVQNRLQCEESSSSSSESSDSECGEVVDMCRLKSGAPALPLQNALPLEATLALSSTLTQEGSMTELQPDSQEEILILPSIPSQEGSFLAKGSGLEIHSAHDLGQECCSGTSAVCSSNVSLVGCDDGKLSLVTGTSEKKIEVCMGGKCKKSGAAAILEEFQRVVGVEGAVGGCKCMGKCRDGPNVRVLLNEGVQLDSVRALTTNPLCIGVGLEDVGLIVSNFFGENEKNLRLAVAS